MVGAGCFYLEGRCRLGCDGSEWGLEGALANVGYENTKIGIDLMS